MLASRLGNCAIPLATGLHVVRIDAWRTAGRESSFVCLFAAIVVDILEIKSMYMARKVAQNCQANIDEQIYDMSASSWIETTKNKIMARDTYPCHILPQPTHPEAGLHNAVSICSKARGAELLT